LLVSRIRIQDCQSFCLIIVNENITTTHNYSLNSVQILGLLQDVYCRKGLRFSVPSNGVYVTYEVHFLFISSYSLIFLQVVETVGSTFTGEIVDSCLLFYKISPSTLVAIQPLQKNNATVNSTPATFQSVFSGYLRENELLLKIVRAGLSMADSDTDDRFTKAALIVGSAGTGKTKLIESIVSVLGCNSVNIDFSVLLSG
jgi:hypothetical protein